MDFGSCGALIQKPGRKCNKTWSHLEEKLEEELNSVNFRT